MLATQSMRLSQTGVKEMSSNKIESIEHLKEILYNKLKDDKSIADILNVFISGQSDTELEINFMLKEDDSREPFIYYPVTDSNDLDVPLAMELDEFCKSIERIINSWPLSEEIIKFLTEELEKLNIRANKIKK